MKNQNTLATVDYTTAALRLQTFLYIILTVPNLPIELKLNIARKRVFK